MKVSTATFREVKRGTVGETDAGRGDALEKGKGST